MDRYRDSFFAEPVLNTQEWKFDKSKAEPGNEYNTGEPDQKNHGAADGKGVNRPKEIEIDAKKRQMGEICAIGNSAKEDERLEIQNGWSSSLQTA